MFFASGFSVGQTAAVVSLTEIIKGPMEDSFVRYPVFKERLFSYGFSEEDSVKKAVLANGKTPWNAFWWDQTGSLKDEYRAPFCQNFRSGIDQEIRATPVTMVSPEIDILLLSGTVQTGYTQGCYTKKELVETLSSVRSAHKKPVFDLTQMKGMSLFGLFRQSESIIKPRSLGLSRQKFCEISTSKLINEKGFSSEQKSFEQANAFCAKTFENKTLFGDNVSLGRVSIEDAQKLDSVVSNSGQVFFEMNSLKPAEDILKRVPQLTEKDLVDIENLVKKNQKAFLVKDPVLPVKKEA